MPPPTKGGALPPKSGKGSIRRSHAHSGGGKAPHKSGSAASGAKKRKSGDKRNKKAHKSARRKNEEKWHYYINKTRQESAHNHKKHSISRRAMNVLGSLVEDMFERIATEAINVAHIGKVKTLSGREIQMAVRLLMEGDLLKYGMSEGTRAVHSYNTNMTTLMEQRNQAQ